VNFTSAVGWKCREWLPSTSRSPGVASGSTSLNVYFRVKGHMETAFPSLMFMGIRRTGDPALRHQRVIEINAFPGRWAD